MKNRKVFSVEARDREKSDLSRRLIERFRVARHPSRTGGILLARDAKWVTSVFPPFTLVAPSAWCLEFGPSLDLGRLELGFWTADQPYAKCYHGVDRTQKKH